MDFRIAKKNSYIDKTLITVGDTLIGGEQIVIAAGPCAVENRDSYMKSAFFLKSIGVQILRGGIFKPRTSPYEFQGLGREGLSILNEAKRFTGLSVVTEVLDIRDIDIVTQYVDIIQIGSRNMQNFPLLKELGRINKPILLKRGLWATLEEWLLAAEYIMAEGNLEVILCERGIRTYETYTRNTFDISAIPAIKQLSHLPVLADPSHATGQANLVLPVSKAAIAAGADGVIIEVHPFPKEALCDGTQSLTLVQFEKLINELKSLAPAFGKKLF